MSKSVPADVYTRDYYLSDCTGYAEFLRSYGRELDPRLNHIVEYLPIQSGENLLDIGCGRGEIVFFAAHHKATAIGIDYSAAAVDLALEARSKQPSSIAKRSSFNVMNAKSLEFKPNTFDWVVMTDVVEHLYKDELEQVYSEVFRVLKPGGKLVIHTEPNKIYNDYVYPWYCFPVSQLLIKINFILTKKKYPGLPNPSLLRTDSHRVMHVNEATYLALYYQLRNAGLLPKIQTKVTILKPILSWKDKVFNFLVALDPFSRFVPFSLLFANDFVVIAKKP